MKIKQLIPFAGYSWLSAVVLANDVTQYLTLMVGLGMSLLFTYKFMEEAV